MMMLLNGCCNGLADRDVVGDVDGGREGAVSGHNVAAFKFGLLVDVVLGSVFIDWAVVGIEVLVL